jgi:hypothetical protein
MGLVVNRPVAAPGCPSRRRMPAPGRRPSRNVASPVPGVGGMGVMGPAGVVGPGRPVGGGLAAPGVVRAAAVGGGAAPVLVAAAVGTGMAGGVVCVASVRHVVGPGLPPVPGVLGLPVVAVGLPVVGRAMGRRGVGRVTAGPARRSAAGIVVVIIPVIIVFGQDQNISRPRLAGTKPLGHQRQPETKTKKGQHSQLHHYDLLPRGRFRKFNGHPIPAA